MEYMPAEQNIMVFLLYFFVDSLETHHCAFFCITVFGVLEIEWNRSNARSRTAGGNAIFFTGGTS
jgi:hypothetical protein